MSNQLDRFQGLSETRWTNPSLHGEPSGEGRKALSRYINEYLAELEESDAELLSRRRKRGNAPPQSWDLSQKEAPKLPMSRQEYIKRQNSLFKELTGYNSWTEVSSAEAAKDSRDKALMTTIELYMAALDEKIYMSADYTRAIIGVRDKLVRDEFEKLRINKDASPEEREKELVRVAAELRDLYRDLWVQHSQLTHQRDALEVEMSHLRHDHALQLAKVLRLEYATHSLGQRLVDAQNLRIDNDLLREELVKQQREKEMTQTALDALSAKYEAQSQTLERLMTEKDNGSTSASLENRIHALYEELTKLKASEDYLKSHKEPVTTPLESLNQALALISIAKDDTDKRISSLIEAFAQQYRSREQELLTHIAALEKEKAIIIARYNTLEHENSEANSDLNYLEQRALSLVLMLKSVRASLDGNT